MLGVSLVRSVMQQLPSTARCMSNLMPWYAANMVRSTSSSQSQSVDPVEEHHVAVHLDRDTGIATLSLNRPPVNSLTLEFMTKISISLQKLHDERDCRGLILTSGIKGIFSGGLDINELFEPRVDRLREVWRMLQEVWIQVYGSHLVTMAAVNGHAPAGGCLLALSCDSRFMANNKYTIGLNGAHLGIVPPSWLQRVMCHTVGHRETERCIGLGHLYSPQEALQAGLVDQVVCENELQARAEEEVVRWMQVPDVARQLTKSAMRREILADLMAARETDAEDFISYICQDSVQSLLGKYLEKLKNKQK